MKTILPSRFLPVIIVLFLVGALVIGSFLMLDGPSEDRSQRSTRALLKEQQERLSPGEHRILISEEQLERERRRIQELERSGSPDNRMRALYRRAQLARKYLQVGKYDEALTLQRPSLEYLESYFARQDSPGTRVASELSKLFFQDALTRFYRLLNENCLREETPDRCYMTEPTWTARKNARTSILDSFRRSLRHAQDRASARWFLNLAHQRLTGNVDSLPSRWRIPEFPEATPGPGEGKERIQNRAREWGVDVLGHAGGAALADFTGNGSLDLVTTGRTLEDQMRFFENRDGEFVERTKRAGLSGFVGGLNLEHFDYNNDGHSDLLVTRGAWPRARPGRRPNTLLRNNGNGTFTDVTDRMGLLTERPTQTVAVADFNRDGWLDLFVGNEAAGEHSPASRLYWNRNGERFEDVSETVGLEITAHVKGASWGDVNGDGRPDLYVSIHGDDNLLFVNQGGDTLADWSFRERAESAGVQGPDRSFSTWFWDYNNDGHDDLFVANFRRTRRSPATVAARRALKGSDALENARPALYQNQGDGTFREVSSRVGLGGIHHVMGANYGDFNADGYPDLYLGTGDPSLASVVPNLYFESRGETAYVNKTYDRGLDHLAKGHAVAFGDVTDNGYSDIYQNAGGVLPVDVARNALYVNDGNDNNWLQLRLVGRKSNRDAIGARLVVHASGRTGSRRLYRTVSTGGSFGASTLRVELGLGSMTSVDKVVVDWPMKDSRQVVRGLDVNRRYAIMEGDSEPRRIPMHEKTSN